MGLPHIRVRRGYVSGMSEFEHQRTIPADPLTAFDIASGPGTLNAWTPEGVDVEPAGEGALHAWVSSGSEVHDATGFVDVDRERRRLSWGGSGDEHYDGWLQIDPADDARSGSVATMHLTFAGKQAEALGGELSEEADRRIEEALDRLAALVAEQTGGRQA